MQLQLYFSCVGTLAQQAGFLICRPSKDCSSAAPAAGSARPVPRSLANSGVQQRPGQGPVTKAVFKMGQGGCLEVHVANHPPLRDALQQ